MVVHVALVGTLVTVVPVVLLGTIVMVLCIL